VLPELAWNSLAAGVRQVLVVAHGRAAAAAPIRQMVCRVDSALEREGSDRSVAMAIRPRGQPALGAGPGILVQGG